MKRVIAIILTLILCFSMASCGSGASNLKEALVKDTVDYNDLLTDTVISYDNHTYRFNNKYNNFTAELMDSFEDYELESNDSYADTDNQYEISFWSFTTGYIALYINDADQIRVSDDMAEAKYYFSSGIYKKIQEKLDPVIDKASKYYSLEQNKEYQTSTYQIFDKEGRLMADDSADRNPHILQLSAPITSDYPRASIDNITNLKSTKHNQTLDFFNPIPF